MNVNMDTQVEGDQSPLPDVDLELCNGFSFPEGVACGVNSSTTNNITLSSSVSSSVSSRHSPWLETPSHTHTRSISQHRLSPAIASHDLPPLDVSDMNWGGSASTSSAHPTTTSALASSTTSSSSSSSSSFSSPCFSSTSPSVSIPINNTKRDSDITPRHGIFDLNVWVYDMPMPMSMRFDVGDMGMGYNMSSTDAGGNDMGMAVGKMDTTWNGQVSSRVRFGLDLM